MELFLKFITIIIYTGCTLVVGVQNPIHSILILIMVFFLGSLLLFILQIEYFALLFMVVYVGAIVVLFLFIVMMLEIKMINTVEKFTDLFSYKNLLLYFILSIILFYSGENMFDLKFITLYLYNNPDLYINFVETNLFTDYSKLLFHTDHLRGIGGLLYTEFKTSVLLAAFLLFVSMIGAIVMTLESNTVATIKMQDANLQSLRNPVLVYNAYRTF